MRSSTDERPAALYDLDVYRELLDGLYPRVVSQIDRDPHSPTFGSCDRGFWMYRLHDFDSGVTQQCALVLAALVQLADGGHLGGCRNLDPADASYWRALALAIARRTAALLERQGGLLDEYYPGERSFPGTVFAAYATLKAALLLDEPALVRHPGLRATAEALAQRQPSRAANQDVAAAAFLALYAATGSTTGAAAARRRAELLVRGEDGRGMCLEYGGADLGYASVSLHFLTCMRRDGTLPAAQLDPVIARLGRLLADFAGPSGCLGGEFASRDTTYFLPLGPVLAARGDAAVASALARLDITRVFEKLDDRYLIHYCLPSLALAAVELADGAPTPALVEPEDAWRLADHRDVGLLAYARPGRALFVGVRKGGAFVAERGATRTLDSGYRVVRDGVAYATCVLDPAPDVTVEATAERLELTVRAAFRRYRSLTASPAKTVALRALQAAGPRLGEYFKRRLIVDAIPLPDVTLHRTLRLDAGTGVLTVDDHVTGMGAGDRLYRSAPASLRLVPSARMHRAGEGATFLDAQQPLTDVSHRRTLDLSQ